MLKRAAIARLLVEEKSEAGDEAGGREVRL
jgi:hypothetical protein